ncbi:MAG: YggT family protein [Treponema sp.]|nr:YggT family protein [Treponema sp.]
MHRVFWGAARVVNIYATVCFIRIILSWFPGALYTRFGQLLSAVCDPYLNLFRPIRWLHVGAVDFSPMLAIGALSALATILQGIAQTGRIYFGGILALLISLVWSVIFALALLLLIVLVIRFVALLFGRNSQYYGSIWSQLDGALSPLVFRMTRIFPRRFALNYRGALIGAIGMLTVILLAGRFTVDMLVYWVSLLPV